MPSLVSVNLAVCCEHPAKQKRTKTEIVAEDMIILDSKYKNESGKLVARDSSRKEEKEKEKETEGQEKEVEVANEETKEETEKKEETEEKPTESVSEKTEVATEETKEDIDLDKIPF